MLYELKYTELKSFVAPESLSFKTTAELEANDGIIGQKRAEASLEFGLNIKMKGYNIYACGAPGTGKTTFARAFAEKKAATEPVPPDLCYIYNFENPKTPKILKLPAGSAKLLKEDMEELINRLTYELPRLFSSKEFDLQKTEIVKEYQAKRDDLIKEMTEEARAQQFGVKTTSTGIYFMPIVDGEVINEEQFESLSQEQKDAITVNSEAVQKRAADVMRQIRDFEKVTRSAVEELEYSSALFTVGHHISLIMQKYEDNDDVISYLLAVKEDILENLEDFDAEEAEEDEGIAAYLPWAGKKNTEEVFTKYKVNVITDNSKLTGAPVIVDFNPTYSNLVGEIEYDNEFGNFSTDFMKIKPGLLHKANGGYLILQASDIFTSIHSWETIRRFLLTNEIITEPLREFNTGLVVSGIKPEPVKADVKIIILGTHFYYELLYEFDDSFQKLFKIRADFDYEMAYTNENVMELARFVKRFAQTELKTEFSAGAVAAIIEYASRLAERQNKLSACFNKIAEILAESSAWASMEDKEGEDAGVITEVHVKKAISEREYRLNMYEEKLSEMIEDGLIMIDTTGKKTAQINGLAVLDMGDYAFAKPSRITATTYVGKAGIVNIEKEAEMSGNIHDKGIQVLTGYLGQKYAQEFPLSVSCRVCFEQNYSGIDGDSASSTELYAILSSIADLPINQEIAVTGSINQRGEIQPIGGVTLKIEGFFDLCKARGLTGRQGVIIPRQNIVDLVLRDDVIEAVKDGVFHIYAITHVDEGIEILTDTPAGEPNEKGKYPADTVHGRVFKKLKDFYKKAVTE